MKKLIMTAAVVACAAVVTAQTVTSANIVGYAKQTVAAGDLIQIVPQFSGTAGGVVLSNMFSGVTSGSGVYLWNGLGFDTYVTDGVGGWYDANNGYAPSGGTVIQEGLGMWMVDGGSGSEPLASGEVPMVSSITNTLFAGLNMIGNPYPTGLELGTIDTNSLSTADAIFSWNGTGYDNYVYSAGTWYDANNSYAPSNDKVLPVGRAFWLNCATGGDIIFGKNF